ncbi:MAG: Rne/Rng family ribonuclease [Hyphomicrobiaceae bacterium]
MEKNKMLIDATHPEETRVVVLRGGRVEEFDFESASRKPLRGNIYLAKVTRVEPSLQAAFIEYGGNRHGFLAFSEIHPDYYQIPFADRQALIDEEVEEEARAEREADARAERRERSEPRERGRGRGRQRRSGGDRDTARNAGSGDGHETGEDDALDAPHDHGHDDTDHRDDQPETLTYSAEHADMDPDRSSDERADDGDADQHTATALAHERDETLSEPTESDDVRIEVAQTGTHEFEVDRGHGERPGDHDDAPEPIGLVEDAGVSEFEENGSGDGATAEAIEQVGAEDALEELPERPQRRRARQYKIQEVIKRRQIILVQVVKEERGNKGAALTTYLSLAGRYTVLMPNTGRGGGISRKITNAQDRKRLKAIAEELEVPEGMGLIVRTAGAARTKQEIRRDFEYLLRLWESVRDLTLKSTAPCLVYEEGNLIKRSLRDLYSKDIDQVLVAGGEAYSEAHGFLSMLMPSHADSVIDYREPEPLFTRFQIERQLNAMFSPHVTLRSGGYLVINQTEALVAIDVNSGKSTREFSIEETALSTNLEASDEIARQLKLRDLAGLIVVDFIDMEEKRNNRAVERRIKDALRNDRARIQVGHISHFGLLEMSRQRLRTGVLEGSTSQCPHCQGTGIIRSTESVVLAVLRGIEDHLMKGPQTSISVLTTAGVALYILNHKRSFIAEIEQRHSIFVNIQASERMQGANFAIERTSEPVVAAPRRAERSVVSMDWGFDGTEAGAEEEADDAPETNEIRETRESGGADEETGEGRTRSRRRRRGRGRRDEQGGPRERADAAGDRDMSSPRDPSDESHGEGESDGDGDTGERRDAAFAEGAPDEGADDGAEGRVDDGRGRPQISEDGDGSRSRRRRRGRRGGRSRNRDGASGIDGVVAGSPADPSAEQPDVDPSFAPHGDWIDVPVTRRAGPETGTDERAWEIKGAAQEPEADPGPRAADVPTVDAASAWRDEPAALAPIPMIEPKFEPQVAEPVTSAPAAVEKPAVETGELTLATAPQEQVSAPESRSDEPPRKGWWQRRFGSN